MNACEIQIVSEVNTFVANAQNGGWGGCGKGTGWRERIGNKTQRGSG